MRCTAGIHFGKIWAAWPVIFPNPKKFPATAGNPPEILVRWTKGFLCWQNLSVASGSAPPYTETAPDMPVVWNGDRML